MATTFQVMTSVRITDKSCHLWGKERKEQSSFRLPWKVQAWKLQWLTWHHPTAYWSPQDKRGSSEEKWSMRHRHQCFEWNLKIIQIDRLFKFWVNWFSPCSPEAGHTASTNSRVEAKASSFPISPLQAIGEGGGNHSGILTTSTWVLFFWKEKQFKKTLDCF